MTERYFLMHTDLTCCMNGSWKTIDAFKTVVFELNKLSELENNETH